MIKTAKTYRATGYDSDTKKRRVVVMEFEFVIDAFKYLVRNYPNFKVQELKQVT
jgi:hypothetical protein